MSICICAPYTNCVITTAMAAVVISCCLLFFLISGLIHFHLLYTQDPLEESSWNRDPDLGLAQVTLLRFHAAASVKSTGTVTASAAMGNCVLEDCRSENEGKITRQERCILKYADHRQNWYHIAPNFRDTSFLRILLEPRKLSSVKCFEKWAQPSRIVDPRNVSKDQSAKIWHYTVVVSNSPCKAPYLYADHLYSIDT